MHLTYCSGRGSGRCRYNIEFIYLFIYIYIYIHILYVKNIIYNILTLCSHYSRSNRGHPVTTMAQFLAHEQWVPLRKSSSIAIYSSPTRQHLFLSNKKTSILLQQEDIYSCPTRRHLFFSNKTTFVLLQQQDIFFSHKKTSLVSIQHIPCL